MLSVEFDVTDDKNTKPTGRWCARRKEDMDDSKPVVYDKTGYVTNWGNS